METKIKGKPLDRKVRISYLHRIRKGLRLLCNHDSDKLLLDLGSLGEKRTYRLCDLFLLGIALELLSLLLSFRWHLLCVHLIIAIRGVRAYMNSSVMIINIVYRLFAERTESWRLEFVMPFLAAITKSVGHLFVTVWTGESKLDHVLNLL